MIFADKLIALRKKNGWTQEDLAEKMNVSRQSITKWEGAVSIPELSKIVKLSELFGVSIDYLLKDDIEIAEYTNENKDEDSVRRVSMEEANAFLAQRQKASKPIALATLLCVFSPICLILLGVLSEVEKFGIKEDTAGGIGIIILLVLVAIAVAVFIHTGSQSEQYRYTENEIFETEYGVNGMVKERRSQFKPTYNKFNIFGTVLCILAAVPIFVGIAFNSENDLLIALMVCVTLAMVGIGVYFFVRGGVVWASFEKLLQEGEYSKQKKNKSAVTGAISTAYWLIATAIYLAYSFITKNWDYSWIVWPVAGVLYAAVIAIVNATAKSSDK